MTKKGLGTRDVREEEDGAVDKFRVDRVFGEPPRAALPTISTKTGAPRPVARPSSQPTNEVELALRRQLSRLQRQLAEAQRELANKDEELAAEVERRFDATSAVDAARRAHDDLKANLDELTEYRARTAGLEQRLQDAISAADELGHQLALERAERAAVATQLEETTAAFERARSLWKDESSLMQEHHASELVHRDAQRRTAVDAVEAQMRTALDRQREALEAEMSELRAAHERSLAALRGELEPKVAAARNLAEEIERLGSELAAARADHARDVAERGELHRWELQQQADTHAAQLATAQRHHAAELAGRAEEIDAKGQALVLAERNAALREQLWEETVAGLRESQKKLQQELAETKERGAQSDASRLALEQRLADAIAAHEQLAAELREVRARVEVAETEAKRDVLDRQRFAAYLEEGLALLGALPPAHGLSGDTVTVQGGALTSDAAAKPAIEK